MHLSLQFDLPSCTQTGCGQCKQDGLGSYSLKGKITEFEHYFGLGLIPSPELLSDALMGTVIDKESRIVDENWRPLL
jgi:hypothetical protein